MQNQPVSVNDEPIYDEIVVCLFDGHYHNGFAALANSLVKANFKGVIYAGYRGNLPPWISQLKKKDNNIYHLYEHINIHFEQVYTDMNLAYYKPYFIKAVAESSKKALRIFYFDVDIIIVAPWVFFSRWLENDVCLCSDASFEFVHIRHPWRKDWVKLAKAEVAINPITTYVNSGFIAIESSNMTLIDTWIKLTEVYKKTGDDLTQINQDGHKSYKGDQDMLNAAITISPQIQFSLIGKEGMGFTQPAYLMLHAVNKPKPWNKNFIIHLIHKGRKPDFSEKAYFNNCTFPIKAFSKSRFFYKKTNLAIATFLGRYIGY